MIDVKAKYPNGEIPGDQLSDLAGKPLFKQTAELFVATFNEVERRYGWRPSFNTGLTGYRSIKDQEKLFFANYTRGYANSAKFDRRVYKGYPYWRKTGSAVAVSVPGKSNHGWGIAGDIGPLIGFDSVRYAQFADVARIFGITNTEGRSVGEYWHWVGPKDYTEIPAIVFVERDRKFKMDTFIKDMYLEYCDRTPSFDEVMGWLEIFEINGLNYVTLKNLFVSSPAEYGTVIRAYAKYLGRPAENDAVVKGWLDRNLTIREMFAEFYASDEAKARRG